MRLAALRPAFALFALLPALGVAVQGADPAPTLSLESDQAGRSPAHRLGLSILAGEPETYGAVLTYPEEFRFNGFQALGPAGTPVGAYELDADLDGEADRSAVLYALGPDSAYVDQQADGAYSPALEPLLRHRGGSRFTLRIPMGGDGRADTLLTAFDARVTLVLFAGLLVSPSLGGVYLVTAELASVDPDTGGHDDDRGDPPEERRFELPLRIEGPALTPFAELSVGRFDLKTDKNGRSRFRVHGRFTPGPASDGLDLSRERVTVAFEGFSQTLPGSAFKATGAGHQFRGHRPGIEKLKLWSDGRFQIEARGLERIAPGPALTFALRIGNDRGEVAVRRVVKDDDDDGHHDDDDDGDGR